MDGCGHVNSPPHPPQTTTSSSITDSIFILVERRSTISSNKRKNNYGTLKLWVDVYLVCFLLPKIPELYKSKELSVRGELTSDHVIL